MHQKDTRMIHENGTSAGPSTSGEPDQYDLLDALQRISSRIASDTNFEEALDALAETVCTMTPWDFCRIDTVDALRGVAQVAARRERLSAAPPVVHTEWTAVNTPTMQAVREARPVLIPDAQNNDEFPEYARDSREFGYVCGVAVPMNVSDLSQPLTVLNVRSSQAVLDDDRQLPFLRSVASLGSLAIKASRESARVRGVIAEVSEAVGVQARAINWLIDGRDRDAILRSIEQVLRRSLVLVDASGAVRYPGTNPVPDLLSDQAWRESSSACVAEILAAAPADTRSDATFEADLGTLDGRRVEIWLDRVDRGPQSRTTILTLTTTGMLTAGDAAVRTLTRSTVAAVLVREIAQIEAARHLEAGLLDDLLLGVPTDPTNTIVRAAYLGLALDQPNVLLAVSGSSTSSKDELTQLLETLRAEAAHYPGAVAALGPEGAILVVPHSSTMRLRFERWLESVVTAVEAAVGTVPVLAVSTPCGHLEQYPAAWVECRQAIQLAHRTGRTGVVRANDFGAARLLLSAANWNEVEGFVTRTLGPLLAYDTERGTPFLETLERFVASGGKFQQTARELHVHVSTLRYRIEKIEKLCGRSLENDDTRFELGLAARIHRLRGE